MIGHAEPLESRLFRGYWDDGLLDVLAGLAVVGIAVFWTVDLVALGPIVPVLLIPFWEPLRRRIVEPRAGLVVFTHERTSRNRWWLLLSTWIGVAVLIVFAAFYFLSSRLGEGIALVTPGVPAMLLGLLAALVALGLGLSRFLGYAGAFCLAGLAVALVDARPEVAMMAGGVVILINGARLLVRFLRIEVEGEEDN